MYNECRYNHSETDLFATLDSRVPISFRRPILSSRSPQTVDFALAGFTITHIRETVIDFTHAFYEEPTTILIPPPREQNNFLAFLEPFSWQVGGVKTNFLMS